MIKLGNSWIKFDDNNVENYPMEKLKVDKQNNNKYIYNIFYEKNS